MDIITFLSDRITEEEALAQAAIDSHPPAQQWDYADVPTDGAHITHWSPWRVMSGCIARRLILAAHRRNLMSNGDGEVVGAECSMCRQDLTRQKEWPCYTVRTLALEYADHRDYRYEWRPDLLRVMR